jgi:transcriptional regulator with XRE-family HTH domain
VKNVSYQERDYAFGQRMLTLRMAIGLTQAGLADLLSLVRALRLAGLDVQAGVQLLAEKDVVGSPLDRAQLVEVYRGNPLALRIVAQTIAELFGGEIVPFLEQRELVFGGVRELLDEQFERLSTLEQSVLFCLAILREPVSLEELLSALSTRGLLRRCWKPLTGWAAAA